MRGSSPEEVAALLLSQPALQGLQGPTISPVYTGVCGCAAAACRACMHLWRAARARLDSGPGLGPT
jgi:hypothetical protein